MSRSEVKSGSLTVARGQEAATVTPLSPRARKAKPENGRKKERRPAPEIFGSDLADLPDELLKELRLGPRTSLDAQILDVFRAVGGSASLDDVLIGLYRKFAVVQKRRFLQNVLWRMVRQGHLAAQRGERGRFSLASALPGTKRSRRR